MHLYFKATALDTMFTLPNKINNQKKNQKHKTSKLVTSRQKSCCSPNSTSLDLRLYTCNEFSFSITLFSSSHTCSLLISCVFLHTSFCRISVFSLLGMFSYALSFSLSFSQTSLSVFCIALCVLSQKSDRITLVFSVFLHSLTLSLFGHNNDPTVSHMQFGHC